MTPDRKITGAVKILIGTTAFGISLLPTPDHLIRPASPVYSMSRIEDPASVTTYKLHFYNDPTRPLGKIKLVGVFFRPQGEEITHLEKWRQYVEEQMPQLQEYFTRELLGARVRSSIAPEMIGDRPYLQYSTLEELRAEIDRNLFIPQGRYYNNEVAHLEEGEIGVPLIYLKVNPLTFAQGSLYQQEGHDGTALLYADFIHPAWRSNNIFTGDQNAARAIFRSFNMPFTHYDFTLNTKRDPNFGGEPDNIMGRRPRPSLTLMQTHVRTDQKAKLGIALRTTLFPIVNK